MDHPENKEDDDHDHNHADDPDATAPVVHLGLLWTSWPESIGGSDRTWAVAHSWYALTSTLRKHVARRGRLRSAEVSRPIGQRLAIVEGAIRLAAVRSTQNYVVYHLQDRVGHPHDGRA
jgi:hypothetical protein